jgi:pyruvate dehydrogenase E1 component alpha subunit
VVFVVVNNGWAISVPLKEQTATRTLAQKAIAAGIPGVQVDGNDVFAVRDAVSQGLETARAGGGPCLIETLTYRLSDHTTADDASRYRADDEVRKAWTLEPLLRTRKYLMTAGAWDEAKEAALLHDAAAHVEAAVAEYLHLAKPSTDIMFDHLFATLPTHLQAQRATARIYAAKHGASKHSGS